MNELSKKPKSKALAQHRKRSSYLAKWILAHPLININGLCASTGYDRSNMARVLDGDRMVSRRIIQRMETALKDYGFIPLPEEE